MTTKMLFMWLADQWNETEKRVLTTNEITSEAARAISALLSESSLTGLSVGPATLYRGKLDSDKVIDAGKGELDTLAYKPVPPLPKTLFGVPMEDAADGYHSLYTIEGQVRLVVPFSFEKAAFSPVDFLKFLRFLFPDDGGDRDIAVEPNFEWKFNGEVYWMKASMPGDLRGMPTTKFKPGVVVFSEPHYKQRYFQNPEELTAAFFYDNPQALPKLSSLISKLHDAGRGRDALWMLPDFVETVREKIERRKKG